MPEEGLATTEAKPTDAAALGAANPAEAPPVKPATGTVSTPAVSAAPAAPAQASTSSSQLGNESSSSAAAAAAKPKLTSEEIEKVEFCRRYLTEVNNDRAASKETIVHALKIKTTLGTGTFGRVRLVELMAEAKKGAGASKTEAAEPSKAALIPKYFALKIMKKLEVVRLKQVEHIRNEKNILMSINHPFLVTLFAVAQDKRNLYMVLEFIIGGELFTHLRKAGKFTNEHGRFYAAQVSMGLQYLHEECGKGCIVYRDLKPENILIDRVGYLKITDFGFAKRIEDRTWTLCGTPEYLAPEIIQSKGHGKAVDWWAIGVLIYEMLAGYPPFYDENPFGIYQLILAGKIEFPRYVETHARDLIRKLLTSDRAKRLGNLKAGGDDVRKHKWYRGLSFDSVFMKEVEAPFVPEISGDGDTQQFDEYPDSEDDGGPEPLSKDVDDDLFGSF